MRNLLCEIFAKHGGFEVRCAQDPYEARQVIKAFDPHVITLDIEMPKMDGITFLTNLMKLRPLPVVMLSTLTHKGSDATLTALELGAVDYIGKPNLDKQSSIYREFSQVLIDKVSLAASSYQVVRNKRHHLQAVNAKRHSPQASFTSKGKVIAIGASTGGIEAIKLLLQELPVWLPPIIITQHVPSFFSGKFAQRLNSSMELQVKQAEQGDVLSPGCVYIAPGDAHLKIVERSDELVCHLDTGPKVNMHRPAVDFMFDSLSFMAPEKLVLVLLTGMGKDGSAAMKKLVDKGVHSLVQDKSSSIVWGMPGAAVSLGCAKEVLPLNKIPAALTALFEK